MAGEVIAGVSMRGFVHLTNATVIAFVLVDFWGLLSIRDGRPRPMIAAYCATLLLLATMQYRGLAS